MLYQLSYTHRARPARADEDATAYSSDRPIATGSRQRQRLASPAAPASPPRLALAGGGLDAFAVAVADAALGLGDGPAEHAAEGGGDRVLEGREVVAAFEHEADAAAGGLVGDLAQRRAPIQP